jgi:hypothetical protein
MSSSGPKSPPYHSRAARGRMASKAGFVNDQLKAADPDEIEIQRLKRQLDDLATRHQLSNVSLAKRNATMADRDDKAARRYRELTKDEIGEEEEQRIAQTRRFRNERDSAEGEEETLRALLVEEEGLERALVSNNDHLTLIGITVSRLYQEGRRRQRDEEAKADVRRNAERMDERARESFMSTYDKDRRFFEKGEHTGFQDILARHHTAMGSVMQRQAQREVDNARQREQQQRDDEAAAQRRAEEEVEDLEREYERRAAAISHRFRGGTQDM